MAEERRKLARKLATLREKKVRCPRRLLWSNGGSNPDLRIANAALSQLSYCPGCVVGGNEKGIDPRKVVIDFVDPQLAARR